MHGTIAKPRLMACPHCGGSLDGVETPHFNGVTIYYKGKVARLTPTESIIIEELQKAGPRGSSMDHMIFMVWHHEEEPPNARKTLAVHISKLRPKLARIGLDIESSPNVLRLVIGKGRRCKGALTKDQVRRIRYAPPTQTDISIANAMDISVITVRKYRRMANATP